MEQLTHFRNRSQAGAALADRLAEFANRNDVLVLALPRGGVAVALPIAQRLGVALDVLVVRKLGLPGRDEYAMGAIASGGVCVLHSDVISRYGISESVIDSVRQREQSELERREKLYRGSRGPLQMQDKVVILVDDGIATGSTMQAAVQLVKSAKPAHLIIAVPVAALDTCTKLADTVDQVICLTTPEPLYAVGLAYDDFAQISDDEVIDMLSCYGSAPASNRRRPASQCSPRTRYAAQRIDQNSGR